MNLHDLSGSLSELYTPCCEHHLPDLVDNDELLQRMMQAAEQIYKDGKMPEKLIDQEITTAIATTLMQAVEEGYGFNAEAVDFDSPDAEMLRQIEANTWQFAGAKNYTQLRQLGDALIDEEGRLRTKAEFIQEALKINSKMSKHFLTAEYNLAVAGSQMAAKWVDIQETKDLFPYLQFDAVLDEQTTEICKPLDGKIYPADHPFWDRYYPPNHYGCRSTVRKLSSGVESEPAATDIPEMFQSNIAKQGLVFPADHPYFVDLPDEVRDKSTEYRERSRE